MFNYRIVAVFKRELREKLMSKSFILMTILLPVFMFGIIAVQGLLVTYEGDSGTKVEIVTESDDLTNLCERSFADLDFVNEGKYVLAYKTIDSARIEEYIKGKRNDILTEKLSAVLFIPNSALKDKQVQYYTNTPNNRTIPKKLDGPINNVLIEEFFRHKNLSTDELQYARMSVDVKGFKVTKEEEVKEEGFGNVILAYLFMFLLYISLLINGQMTMQSVQEEKNTKVVEVLLSSVQSKELLTGKIFGASVTATLQMAIWLLPVIALISTTWFVLPPELTIDITLGHIFYLLINFFLGLIIFVGLFAVVGSIFQNAQEAQSGMWPVMLLIMIPFFVALSMMRNPTNPIAEVSSFLPFATVMVMPGRYTLVDLPLWQLFASLVINVATILAIFPVAGKIYRVGILRTGKKPTWGEVVKWVKYKY